MNAPNFLAAIGVLEDSPATPPAVPDGWTAALLEQSAIAIAYLDAAGIYRYANRAYRQRRCRSTDPCGRHMREVLGETVFARLAPTFGRALAGENYTLRLDLRDTPMGLASQINYVPHLGPDGRVEGVGIMVTDITEQANEVDEVRDLLEAAPDAMIIVDEAGRIDRLNQMAEHLFGYRRDELLGQPVEALLPPTQRAAHAAQRHQYKANTETRRPMGVAREVQGRREDGTLFPAEVTLSPIHRRGTTYVAASIRDVTARRTAEDALRRLNTELEMRVTERTAELGRHVSELEAFSYSVSHDLRAPLRHITGFCDLLLKSAPGPEQSAHCLRRIHHAAERMHALIDGMLALARLNKAPLNVETVDLGALVEDIREELEQRTPGPQVHWTVAQLPRVNADPVLLRTALTNLLENAIKYSRKRERPAIAIELMSSSGPLDVVVVKDNGDGFDMKYAGRLFTPFQRLHHEHEFEGVGIGLATVRRVVERHGGRIWAEAKKGLGASFFFTVRNAEYAQRQ